jgi:hypothetical protein
LISGTSTTEGRLDALDPHGGRSACPSARVARVVVRSRAGASCG